MATPENDHKVVSQTAALLTGYGRSFNKRSPVRGCPKSDAFMAFESPMPGFISDEHVASLAVGTEANNSVLFGILVSYRAEAESDMLNITDKREGFDANSNSARLGYLRKQVTVNEQATGQALPAWVYLSNPDGPYHLVDTAPLETRAKILINATPRPGTPSSVGGRALGLHYLEQIRHGLATHGVIDIAMEKMAEAVLDHPGPWQSMLSIPKNS